MSEKQPSTNYWHVTLKREVKKWGKEFTENWTLNYYEGSVSYKLRIVGPQGEVLKREEIAPQDIESEVRAGFEELLEETVSELHG